MKARLSYANVMASLALFLALTGATALAFGVPKNSVSSKTIKNGSLLSADLADGEGVTGPDVADGSLSGADFGKGSIGDEAVADGAIDGAKIADGSLAGAQLGPGAVTLGSLAPDSVTEANIRNNSLRGADFGANAVTAAAIDESTLGTVAEAELLSGSPPSGIISDQIYELQSEKIHGTETGNGTFEIVESCNPGDVILSGGPIEAFAGMRLLESHEAGLSSWAVRVSFGGGSALGWVVRVICARSLR